MFPSPSVPTRPSHVLLENVSVGFPLFRLDLFQWPIYIRQHDDISGNSSLIDAILFCWRGQCIPTEVQRPVTFPTCQVIREKRTVLGQTSHPSPFEVSYQTGHTEAMAFLIRTFLSFERKWFDLMSDKSTWEITAFIVLGVISTFLVIFFPLAFVLKAVTLPLPILKKKRSIQHEPHLDFSLPKWMDEMESWVETHKPPENRYRCCFYPTAEPEGFARCFPLLPKYIYPWNNPCTKEDGYQDVAIDDDYKLH